MAINCLSNIVTEDLGQELLPELLHLLSHPSPYVRKKALLCLYKVFLKYPQGLRLSFDQIKRCLSEDPHASVVSCAVNVITELSDKNPRNYLPLAPAFFKLLTSSANNWMLIKVVKLLGSLVPEEPRLARKLLDPLSDIVKSTHAKSLLYEAVFAITLCLPYVKKANGAVPSNLPDVVALCVKTLRDLISDTDQNLKYLGLVCFGSLLLSQPKVLHSNSECKGLVLKCLTYEDVTIRSRALGLLGYMATQRNLVDLVTQLLGHVEAASGDYRCDLVGQILRLCSADKYELVDDFAWYVDVLVVLVGVRGVEREGDNIARQWTDVAWRVLPVRAYAVRRSLELLVCRGPGAATGEGGDAREEKQRHIIPEVLPAAAWVVGEYSDLMPEALLENEGLDPRFDELSKGPYHALVQSLTAPTDAAGMNPLSAATQAVFVQNSMKAFAAACHMNQKTQDNCGMTLEQTLKCSDDELCACVGTLMKHLPIFSESPDVEVRERGFTSYQLLLSIGLFPAGSNAHVLSNNAEHDAPSIAAKCRASSSMLTYLLVPEPMKPISAKAQKRKLAEGPPSPVSVQEWEEDVNWSVFSSVLNEETPWFDKEGNIKGNVESICFTKQLSNTTTLNKEDKGGGGTNTEGTIGNEASDMALFGAVDSITGAAHQSDKRHGDPFYLTSSAAPSLNLLDTTAASGEGTETAKGDAAHDAVSTRFGSIKLESGGESEEGFSKAKSPKKKKKKKSKKTTHVGSKHHQFEESDDDDGDNTVPRPKQRNVSKEFHNLALVDLTTPLGEDEVLPRNEHYVVPERQVTEPTKSSHKRKNSKKKKSKSKKSLRATAEGDLLGFNDIVFAPPAGVDNNMVAKDRQQTAVESSMTSAPIDTSNNPISNAFDDLLGLKMPVAELPTHALVLTDAGTVTKEKPARTKLKEKKKKKEKKTSKKK